NQQGYSVLSASPCQSRAVGQLFGHPKRRAPADGGLATNEETTMRVTIMAALVGFLLAGSAYAEEPATDRPALWGSPTIDHGACCKTLGEVRSNIDRIDRQIIRLMAERSHYVHDAARFKANPAQVEAPQRAEAVGRFGENRPVSTKMSADY